VPARPLTEGRRPALALLALLVPFAALLAAAAAAGARAQVAADWPQLALTAPITGFSDPVGLYHAGDASDRLFVIEQRGRIRIIRNNAILPTPFLSITNRVVFGSEQGLLGLAFPPGYASKGYFYVNYTNRAGDTVIARYHLTANPDLADPASEQVVLTIGQPYPNHNGGQLAFGPDGYLYIGMGDGGSGNDPQNRAQNPNVLLGKMLRIDTETGQPATYTVPPSNPFIGQTAYRPEIWALGLRNPWRFSFDRQTGDLYIGDVGQDSWEEVDFQPAGSAGGQNYGWRIYEGSHCTNLDPCNPAGLTFPVAEYSHSFGCSVTGGFVYRRADYPRLQGTYFYADYCSGIIWGLRGPAGGWQNQLLLDSPYSISSFGEDEAGRLYVLRYADNGAGTVYLLTDTGPTATPTPTRTIRCGSSAPTATPLIPRAFLPVIAGGGCPP
jgi:glucose/arabinose dehydrogenase